MLGVAAGGAASRSAGEHVLTRHLDGVHQLIQRLVLDAAVANLHRKLPGGGGGFEGGKVGGGKGQALIQGKEG